MAAVRKNKLNVVIAEQNNMVAVTSLGRICREGTSEREHNSQVDLVEKVTWRSLLKDGSFNIKYDDDDGD
ncbi:hypothetical protein LguiA_034409 [Lonicera macranthoides]